jgi:glutamate N-acetyltransferase/amino-acid N-acetyltransferase
MSTNDMVLILANGMAQNKKIVEKTKEFKDFAKALETIFLSIAKLMIRDAEGATKFVEIAVRGAQSQEDAALVSRSVASSNLFKCALYGCDPNWGRIAAAVGYAGAHVDPWKLNIYLGKELVLRNGGRVKKRAAVLNRVFAQKNIKITVDLGLGRHSATAYTCDFSTNYVRINSAYRT